MRWVFVLHMISHCVTGIGAMSSECESGGTAAELVFKVGCSIFDLKNYYDLRKTGVLTVYFAIDSL